MSTIINDIYPKISIVTVVLNDVKTLEQTMLSVIEQKYTNIEYIVIDGGSTDGSVEIIQKYADRIFWWKSEPDNGISDAFNKGILKTSGVIIGIVSADDYLLPNALESVVHSFRENEWPDLVHGNVVACDIKTGKLSISRPDSSLKSIFRGQPLKHGATFIRRNSYDQHGMYDTNYRYAMDYDLVMRFILNGARCVYTNQEYAVVRSGGINVRHRNRTRIESRKISIRHGYPRLKADFVYIMKIVIDNIKKLMEFFHLQSIMTLYRRFKGRNVPFPHDSISG